MKTNKVSWHDSQTLHFQCQECGHCCAYEPGVVLLTDQEADNIARALGVSDDELSMRYLRVVNRRLALKERPNYDCVLLDEGRRCLVYEVRPQQCRTWPFWPSNLESQESWERAALECPGILIDVAKRP